MPRPPEYDSLLRIGSFKRAVANPASIAQFMRTADDMAAAAAQPVPDSARFIRAPIPPITRSDAEAMQTILAHMLPAARALMEPPTTSEEPLS